MSGNSLHTHPGILDRMRQTHGTNYMRRNFIRAVNNNTKEAEKILSDENNSFPVIYLLAPTLEAMQLVDLLPRHAVEAMYLTTAKWGETERASFYADGRFTAGTFEISYETLCWMLKTGADWEGPSEGPDSYDAAIDAAAAFFADCYDDSDILLIITKLIYKRNRRGLNVHELTWGLFHTADPVILSYIAGQLLSKNEIDVELTCRLMGFDDPGTTAGRRRLYAEYSDWLAENSPYLYATCEHYNCTSTPYHVRHDCEAKYLCRKISPRDRTPLEPLSQEEYHSLLAYRENKNQGGEKTI